MWASLALTALVMSLPQPCIASEMRLDSCRQGIPVRWVPVNELHPAATGKLKRQISGIHSDLLGSQESVAQSKVLGDHSYLIMSRVPQNKHPGTISGAEYSSAVR